MSRAAVVWVALAAGCVPTHVAAIDRGGTDTEEGSGAVTDSGTDTSCDAPSPRLDCGVADGPLQSSGLACHDSVTQADFSNADPGAWRAAREFGNAFWVSQNRDGLLVLSTGQLPDATPSGQVALSPGAGQLDSADNDNPVAASLPSPINPTPGSSQPFVDCDGIGDCSHSLAPVWSTADDLVWFSVELEVPAGVQGYVARVALFTAEYPERLESLSSDTFVWWASGQGFTGNLATYRGQAATVAGLAELLEQHTLDDQMLLRTGFDGGTGQPCTVGTVEFTSCPIGATTGWMTLRGPAEPGERLMVAAALYDQVDALLDTVVVIDDWRWTCSGCVPGESCGLSPLDAP